RPLFMDVVERLNRHLSQTPDNSRALFIAPNATILGDVVLGEKASIWYGAILRGDINSIRLGAATNLHDGVIAHISDDSSLEVGEYTTVGHRAILHACKIGNECLIGMGATILDGAEIGDRTIIGANTLVPQNMKIPPGSLVYGNPARIVRTLNPAAQEKIRHWAIKYLSVATAHQTRH